MSESAKSPATFTLPVLAMRDTVLFPGVSMPIGAGRAATLRAIEAALRDSRARWSSRCPSARTSTTISPENLLHDRHHRPPRPGAARPGRHAARCSTASAAASSCAIAERDGYLEAMVREAEEMLPLDARRRGLRRRSTARRASARPSSASAPACPRRSSQQVLEAVDRAGPPRRPGRRPTSR